MKKRFTRILAALALLAFMTPSLVAWGQTRTEVVYDFSQINFTGWTNSYAEHVVEYDDATVTFAAASKQTQTITDIPVTKGQPVSLVLNNLSNQITSATFVCRQWGSKAQTITLHYSTNGGSDYTSTNITSSNFTISSSSLPEGTNAVKITFSSTSNQVGIASATINIESSTSTAVATQVTIDDTGITNTDVYTNTEAGSLSATVSANNATISGAAVTWSSSNTDVATINENGVVTLVAAGNTTITAAYAGVEGQYLPSSATYTLEVTDSTPFTGGDVTFKASEDIDPENTVRGKGSITKSVVTFACSDGILGNGSEYRLYQNSTTTISTTYGVITRIAFTQSGTYAISNLSPNSGTLSEGIWTGSAIAIEFAANAQVRASQIVVTVAAPVTIATPTFNPEGGVFLTPQSVEISCETDDVNIYYTTDGSNPDATSTLYTGAISVSTNTTLKAIAIKNGESSYIGEATFTFPEIVTIAAARALNNNEYALVQGVVTFIDDRNVYVQDATAGICLYLNSETVPSDLTIGDMVKAYGKKTVYHGLVELGSIDGSDANMFVISSTGNELPLAVKTTAEILEGAAGDLQSTRVKIEGAEIGEINTSGNTPLTQGSSVVNLYKIPALAETIEEGDNVDVIGVIGYYDAAQIRVASAADVVEVQLPSFELEIEAENGTVAVYIGEEQQTGTDGSYQIPQNSLVTLTATPDNGYRFVEWQVAAEEGTVTITDNQFTMPACYVLVQAVFEQIPYHTYAYSINGDQGSAISVQEGTEITLASGDNYNESFTFAGWTTVANDFTTILEANSTYTVMEDVVFYAVYAQTIISTPEERVVILDGDATGLTSTQTNVSTQSNLTENDFSYIATGVKYQSLSSATNNFSSGKTILIGKKNAYLYNTTPFGDGITKFEIYHNGGNVSTTVTVAVQFANEAITQYNTQGDAWTATLDQADHVFDVTVPEGAKYFYYTVTNDKNSQDQFRITYVTSGSTTTYYTNISSYPLTINGYTDDNSKTGYYLIASPVTVDLANHDMTTGNFDLYQYDDTQDKEWLNWKGDQELDYAGHFNLVPGTGYLYAKKATTETPSYTFNLTGTPYDGNGEINIISGWNLVGNPFAVPAEISMDYYYLTPDATELIATTASTTVAAMQGVFVNNSNGASTVIFVEAETGTNNAGESKLALNLTRNRGNLIDRAIVRFGEGNQLPKFQINPRNTKIYVTEGNKDYAIVRSAAEAEMPVSFRASENGTYTLAVEAENVEMNYLHLIDNLTGMDVDLLQTPSYTFEAKTSDYTSRFRLVFKANSTNENNAETFAYFNGTNWTVSNVGDATLQVVDVTGRTVANQMITGNAELNLNQPAGVYVIRLVNGDNVKTQKVVVR